MSDIEAPKERLTIIGESFVDIITSQTDSCVIGPTSTVITALDPEGIADYSVSIGWDINGA